MLILTRRTGEKIFIGNNKEIEITVLEQDGKNVKIGINAPKDKVILREEVYNRMQNNHAPRRAICNGYDDKK
jgi:carbon storage regulator